jgi:hypothetical protein
MNLSEDQLLQTFAREASTSRFDIVLDFGGVTLPSCYFARSRGEM